MKVLIHPSWSKVLKDEFNNSTEIMKLIKKIYSDNTSMSKKQLGELLKRELYLGYDECKRINFIKASVY